MKNKHLKKRWLLFMAGILCPAIMMAQSVKINGSVVDENSEPVIGATVIIKGTVRGTITDIDGKFSMDAPDSKSVLVISYVGYQNQEIEIGTKRSFYITLEENQQVFDEVVIIGYGTQKKGSVTGSITSVDTKELEDLPSANLSASLAGRLSGVQISSTTGKPGAGSTLSIRAKGTINNSDPLYVIDGAIRDKEAFDALDASEVASISVLKDGASAAVYGSRAANGVVLVATKKGGSSKPIINYSGTIGFDDPTKTPEMMSAYDQAVFLNNNRLMDWIDKGSDPNVKPEDQKTWYTDDELEHFKNVNYSFLDAAWKTPFTTRHAVNVTGGLDKVRYFIGGSYYYAAGSFENLKYKKYNFRANIDTDVTKDFTVGLNISSDDRYDRKPYWSSDGDRDGMDNLYASMLKRSKMNPLFIDGLPVQANGLEQHPITMISEKAGSHTKKWQVTNINFFAEYRTPFLKGLKFKIQYNRTTNNRLIKIVSLPYTLYKFEQTGGNGHYIDPDNTTVIGTDVRGGDSFVKKANRLNKDYQLNLFVTYDKTIGKNDISALFVYEQAEGESEDFDAQRYDLISWTMPEFHAASSDPSRSVVGAGGVSESGRLSYVGRLNYAYDDKYLLEAAFRIDGSTKFAPSKRWGFFPSVSAGWRISSEPFFANNIKVIDYLKLRGSIATLGNDAIGGWDWMPKYTLTTGAIFGSQSYGVQTGTLANENLTWEKSTSYNIGFDSRWFDNKFSFSLEYFYRHTYDILDTRSVSVPTTFGAKLPKENYSVIDARGFEVELGYNSKVGKNFQYYIRANFSYADSWWEKRDEAANQRAYLSVIGKNAGIQGQSDSGQTTWGYDCPGIIRSQEQLDAIQNENIEKHGKELTILGQKVVPGMLLFKDVRGVNDDEPDGIVTVDDKIIINNKRFPPISYGFTIGGKWKGFMFDVFFQGLAGHKRIIDDRAPGVKDWTGTFGFWNDHWMPDNQDASMPFPLTKKNNELSTFWVRNASFLRCKNATLSYDIPASVTKKIHLQKIKVFVNGTNLFLLEDHLKIADPEIERISSYPVMRNFSLGLNITL